MAAVEYFGSCNKRNKSAVGKWLLNHAAIVIVVWFLVCLAAGHVGSIVIPKMVSHYAYKICTSPNAISRKGRGESLTFVLRSCPDELP